MSSISSLIDLHVLELPCICLIAVSLEAGGGLEMNSSYLNFTDFSHKYLAMCVANFPFWTSYKLGFRKKITFSKQQYHYLNQLNKTI